MFKLERPTRLADPTRACVHPQSTLATSPWERRISQDHAAVQS
jgi:hypothetical protein